RELLVEALDLLQAQDVRLLGFDPRDHALGARADRVDVPRRELHRATSGDFVSRLRAVGWIACSDLNQPFFANQRTMPSAITSITSVYTPSQCGSGRNWKFIPYNRTMNVSGMKIVEMIVRSFITSFMRFDTLESHTSSSDEPSSRYVSSKSISCTVWS